MYLKKMLIGLIGFSYYLNLMGPYVPHQPLSGPVPLSLCDIRYSVEMDKAFVNIRNIGNSAARADLMDWAKEYMILVKRQQDLDISIRAIESKIFNIDAIRILREPLARYINCKNQSDRGTAENGKYAPSFEVNAKLSTITRLGTPLEVIMGPCDHLYREFMKKALTDIRSVLKVELTEVATEYMILIKKQQDIDVRIREMELRVFSSSVRDILRRPLAEYVKCRDSVRTGTYSINFRREPGRDFI